MQSGDVACFVVVVCGGGGVAFIISFQFDIEYSQFIIFRSVQVNEIFLCFAIKHPIDSVQAHTIIATKQIQTGIINTDLHTHTRARCSL